MPIFFTKKNNNSANSPYNFASYHLDPVSKTSTSAGVRQSQSGAHNELALSHFTDVMPCCSSHPLYSSS